MKKTARVAGASAGVGKATVRQLTRLWAPGARPPRHMPIRLMWGDRQ